MRLRKNGIRGEGNDGKKAKMEWRGNLGTKTMDLQP